MAAQIGLKLGEWLFDKGHIKEDQIDIVRYAFEILCSELTDFIVIILYGIFTNQMIQTILYLIFFHVLRQCFKGYHAKTILRCMFLTMSSYLVSLLIYTHVNNIGILLCLIISSLLQIEYCIKKKEVKPILVSVVFWVIIFILATSNMNVDVLQLLAVVELIVSISLIPERRAYHEE